MAGPALRALGPGNSWLVGVVFWAQCEKRVGSLVKPSGAGSDRHFKNASPRQQRNIDRNTTAGKEAKSEIHCSLMEKRKTEQKK